MRRTMITGAQNLCNLIYARIEILTARVQNLVTEVEAIVAGGGENRLADLVSEIDELNAEINGLRDERDDILAEYPEDEYVYEDEDPPLRFCDEEEEEEEKTETRREERRETVTVI